MPRQPPAAQFGLVLLLASIAWASAGVAAEVPQAPAGDAPPPNIIILFVDDFGWGDVGSFWSARNDTPHIDSMLAARGMRLLDFHAMSLCAPSRASLMTGRLGLRNGVINNFGPYSLYGLPRTETTLPHLLQQRFYKTLMTGKWHLGIQQGFHPLDRGFDTFLGLPMSHDYGCTDTPGPDGVLESGCPNWQQDRCLDYRAPGDPHDSCHISPTNPWNESIPLYFDKTIIEQPANLHTLCQRYIDHGIEFMRETLSRDHTPFFYYAAFNHMHVPLSYNPAFDNATNSSSTTEHGHHFGNGLRELDYHIGRLLTEVDRLGIANNTLIFFTGDNGGPSDQCEYGGSNGPFQGMWLRTKGGGGGTGKTTTWEGGHRVASIVRWQGRIPANTTSTALTSTLDILPTVAAVAGLHLPPDRFYDGKDLSPVLFQNASEHHEFLMHPNNGEGVPGAIETVRWRNFKAKYRTRNSGGCPHWPAGQAGSGGEKHHDPPLIFDLSADQAEQNPLDPTSSDYQTAHANILRVWQQFNATVASDRLSKANFSEDSVCTVSHCIKPCCNPANVLCTCHPMP